MVVPHVAPEMMPAQLPAQSWIECASCIGNRVLDDSYDPVEWARGHTKSFPTHDRFRILNQSNFRLVPEVTLNTS